MREVGAAACLVVALTGAAASAQPSSGSGTAGWRAAVSAALAFGYAEGKMLALERHSIPAALTTKKAADAALDELDRRASEARDAFLFVERYGSAYWTVAAELRIGDAFECRRTRSRPSHRHPSRFRPERLPRLWTSTEQCSRGS